jgi:hypothetical protein
MTKEPPADVQFDFSASETTLIPGILCSLHSSHALFLSLFAVKPPKSSMRITILTIGSRGDIQPFIALALGLQKAGHDVKIATHEAFYDYVTSFPGLRFFSIGG